MVTCLLSKAYSLFSSLFYTVGGGWWGGGVGGLQGTEKALAKEGAIRRGSVC